MKFLKGAALSAAMLTASLPAHAALITYSGSGSTSYVVGEGAYPASYLQAFTVAGSNTYDFQITVDSAAGAFCGSSFCYASTDFFYSVNGKTWASSSLAGSKARFQVDQSPGGNGGIGILFERVGDLLPAVDGGESFYAGSTYLLPIDYLVDSAAPTDASVTDATISGSFFASLSSTADYYPNGGGAALSGNKTALQVAVGSAVPEPKSWAMMILGFGVVGYARRRRSVLRLV